MWTVEHIDTSDKLTPLRESWNLLAGPVPFLSWDWLEAWWATFGQKNGKMRLLVLVLRDEAGKVRAIAPWYIENLPWFGATIRFLGSGEACSDYLSLLVSAQDQSVAISFLTEWLVGEGQDLWSIADFAGVSESDEIFTAFMDSLAQQSVLVETSCPHRCWRLALPSRWDDYLKGRSSTHRSELRHLDRDYLKSQRAVIHTVTSEAERRVAFQMLIRLHQRRRHSLGDRGSFSSERFCTFHDEVTARLLRLGTLRFYWLEVDGTPVAIHYDISGGKLIYGYAGGIDPEGPVRAPGKLMYVAAFQQAIREGFEAYDFLRGDEPYKMHWRGRPVPALRVRLISRKMSTRLRQRSWNVLKLLKRQVRGYLLGTNVPKPDSFRPYQRGRHL